MLEANRREARDHGIALGVETWAKLRPWAERFGIAPRNRSSQASGAKSERSTGTELVTCKGRKSPGSSRRSETVRQDPAPWSFPRRRGKDADHPVCHVRPHHSQRGHASSSSTWAISSRSLSPQRPTRSATFDLPEPVLRRVVEDDAEGARRGGRPGARAVPGLDRVVHGDVPARESAASGREHAVSLDLRRQRREVLGTVRYSSSTWPAACSERWLTSQPTPTH